MCHVGTREQRLLMRIFAPTRQYKGVDGQCGIVRGDSIFCSALLESFEDPIQSLVYEENIHAGHPKKHICALKV
jgi:hypothetical protein